MYKNKKDVDKHVEKLMSKLSLKDFNARAYTVARLYFDVGDYESCKKYLEQYLASKANNAAAHKLLGQTFKKLGHKDKALDEFKISLDLDPTHTKVILDVCELLADDEVTIDPGRAKYWCEKAELTFPKHPVTFKLREKLLTIVNPNPEALVKLLTSEIAARPKDAVLHVRLLKHYLSTNKTKEAFDHSCNVEFGKAPFVNSSIWYETLLQVLKFNADKISDWLYQLLLLTVKERLCTLSLAEVPPGSSMSLLESNEYLHDYDQAIVTVIKAGPAAGYAEFHTHLLRHHQGQFAFLAATLVLKRAKKDKLNWYDATNISSLLLLNAWQTVPVDPIANWLTGASEKQKAAVFRWYTEASYRCSQSGHIILGNNKEKGHLYLDQISQFCSGNNWQERLFENIFISKDNSKRGNSYITSVLFQAPTLRLPQKVNVHAYDSEAQKLYPNSLHHFIWILSNYKNYADFKCTIFDMLSPTTASYGPESLSTLDILAFLYCATLTALNQKEKRSYILTDTPSLIPTNISDLLCSLPQIKWWDCAYKFSQNELGSEYTDIRSTLSRGIEVVRCVDNHGLDPELLCILGRTFNNLSKEGTEQNKNMFDSRAYLYYSSAVPLLDKLKSKLVLKLPINRLFDYSHKELDNKALNSLLHESKFFVALKNYNDEEYVKAIEYLADLKSPESYYYLGASYHKIASEERQMTKVSDNSSKYVSLLTKAKYYAFKALEGFKEIESYKSLPLYSKVQELIENTESCLNYIDSNHSFSGLNDSKYSSDDVSDMDNLPIRNIMQCSHPNLSSTPNASKKQLQNITSSNYRTAMESRVFYDIRGDHHNLKINEEQIKSQQKRDASIEEFKEQTRNWFDENRKLGNQIINTIHSNIEQTTEQFKLLKLSVEQVKDQVSEYRKECKDVSELKKQISELKKEINKLKKFSSEQIVDENDLYNLDDEYKTNDNTTFGTQIPFVAPQVIPQYPQRLVPTFPVPPNPYHLYGQNFCNIYNQYSQLAQNTTIPGSSAMFDPNRGQQNYPGIGPISDQMYLDVAHLIPPGIPPPPLVVPTLPNVPVVSIGPTALISSTSSAVPTKTTTSNSKPISRSLPVNVVITSSDPLPVCTSSPAPILSVTIPQKHIKASPHNYQIPLPPKSEAKSIVSSIFNLSVKNTPTVTSSDYLSNWSKPSSAMGEKIFSGASEPSKTVVDGPFNKNNISIDSPNVSINKSRTLSERSNTSIENYDPCPDFKPIIPLPAEVKVTTGEENETAIFSARAKLFRFIDKQWKERGIGEMKLLRHNVTGKVRVLMRREQVHKICANHIIVPEMEIKPMKNETKAYFWVANDFAEESLLLEKFCIRFKTSDIAKEFFDAFEKARIESSASNIQPYDLRDVSKKGTEISLTSAAKNNANLINKPTVGGFTFNSTPSFKVVPEVFKKEKVTDEIPISKANVFSGITFKSSTTSPFSNVISTIPTNTLKIANNNDKDDTKYPNISDVVEEFEPTAEFKPVVPLPALVDQKTGEEDETILFEHRAKLLRFDGPSKEWKERGLGNIKVLVNKDNNQKARLLMRREQIMKVCCNHAITKKITLVKMPNMDKAVTWYAKDFSEGELVSETFCLRFKTVQACNDFIEAVKKVQDKLGDDITDEKKEDNVAKQSNQTGFGDQFKSLPGTWYCNTCYTNNLESFNECVCCEQPMIQDKGTPSTQSGTNVQTKSSNSWGDQFKPKPGTWECKQCLIRNQAENVICSACNIPNDPNLIAEGVKKDNLPKFNFNVTSQASLSKESVSVASGWGDKFKPKEGSWECQQCFVRIEKDKEVCPACNSPKNPSVTTSAATSLSDSKFSFGISQNPTGQVTAPLSSLFNANASSTFKFGVVQDNEPTSTTFTGVSVDTISSEAPSNNTTQKIEPTTGQTPALLPTPKTPSTSNLTFGSREGGTFNFAFKPKSPAKGKSPAKSPKSVKGDESGDEEYISDDEGTNIHFSPVIPMPDKVAIVTGEENEDELYGHRAKLFIFTHREWKERGLGIVKILKHQDSAKLRVLMRREHVHKICLNHILSPDVIYKAKDEKTWYFSANDYSEGELHLQQFCIRFQNKTIALKFKDEIDKAIENLYGPQHKDNIEKEDDVVFVSEIQASEVDKQRAKELLLPENFFTYTEKQPCEGCRGCDKTEHPEESNAKHSVVKLDSPKLKVLTPAALNNITTSVYGTPSSLDRTIDTTTFGTPLSSTFSKDLTSDKTNIANPLNFATRLQQASVLSTKNSTSFSNEDTSTPKSTEKQSTSSEAKNLFGSANKSFFASSNENKISSSFLPNLENENENVERQKSEVKSIFSSDNYQPSVNLFSQSIQGSLFGPKDNKVGVNPSGGIFGQAVSFSFGNVKEKPAVTEEKENSTQPPSLLWKQLEMKANSEKDKEIKSEEDHFKIDKNLSFVALSTMSTDCAIQKKSNDFKWVGAGQQVFSTATVDNKQSNDGNTAGDEEYDPHYEPIVPLPDKIVVTTGEEDEEKVYGERCKLYRFDEKSKEWKERGIGEMKILYHPEKNSYRMLLRREQVHKAVLNMLIFMDLELLPMKNSDRAWTWAGRNFADSAGEQETLAVRFKSVDLASHFRDKVLECVRKLQVAAAEAIRRDKEAKALSAVAPLRLPLGMDASARVGKLSEFVEAESSQNEDQTRNGESNQSGDNLKQVHFQEQEHEESDYEHDYGEDYDGYYNEEEEEESAMYYACDGEVIIEQDGIRNTSEEAHVQVLFDQDVCSPKILVTDNNTGEILADMLIHTDTVFHILDDSCSWSGIDYTSNIPANKSVTVKFPDSSTSLEFYDSCETSKASTYESHDPES